MDTLLPVDTQERLEANDETKKTRPYPPPSSPNKMTQPASPKKMTIEEFEALKEENRRKIELDNDLQARISAVLNEEMKKIEALDDQLLIQKAKNLGLPHSGQPDKKTFLIKENETLESSERDVLKEMVNAIDRGRERNVIDLTRSIQVWAKMVKKAAGNKMVVWSPDSIMNKVTFTPGSTNSRGDDIGSLMNERVYLEVGNSHFEKTSAPLYTEDFTKTIKGDVSSVHVADMSNPKESDKATEDDEIDMISTDLKALSKKVTAAQKAYSLSKEKRKAQYEALAAALEDSGLKANHKILTEEEVKMMTPDSPEAMKEKAEMLKKFKIEAAQIGEATTAEVAESAEKSKKKDSCGPGCKCGMDRECRGCWYEE